MRKKLLIIGASGHGKVAADIALKMKRWEQIAFLDDNAALTEIVGHQVIGRTKDVHAFIDQYDVFVGIGNNAVRARIQTELEYLGATIPILVHPDAKIGERVEIGSGSIVMAGAVINCCTKIGRGCIVNTSCSIDHDSELHHYVHVSPGVHIAGNVKVGNRTWLGIGSVVSNNVSIVGSCIIGAGAVVVKDITEHGTYIGVPVRRVRS